MALNNLIRRATPLFFVNKKDITDSILPFVKSVENTENLEGSLDEFVMRLKNESNKLLTTNWLFPKNTLIEYKIKTLNWENEFEGEKIQSIGKYYIDLRQLTRDSATFKAISGPLIARDTKHSKIWANISLEALGKEFANKYNLKFFYKVNQKIILEDIKQNEEPDFSFLNKIAQDEGVKLKITNETLVLFEEEIFTKSKPLMSISLNFVNDFTIKDKSNDIYDGIEVSYFDVLNQEEKKFILTKNELEGKKKSEFLNKIFKYKVKPRSGDLKKIAQKKLENLNKREIEISVKIVGCKELYTGSVVQILDAGEFSGKYVITQIKHTLPNFLTSFEAYKIKGGSNDK